MKLILITGLDGSGKSTLLSRLEALPEQSSHAYIRVPAIEPEKFKQNKKLYLTSLFINKLNHYADNYNAPTLKAFALFASMLLFKELLKELENNSVIFCERHPLIDTGVYARFYSDKMNPDLLSHTLRIQLENEYSQELDYLLEIFTIKKLDFSKGKFYAIFNFMYQWFSVGKKFNISELKQLFKIDLPDKIYYLKAEPETLTERLTIRKKLEAHETKTTFERLAPFYNQLFTEVKTEIEILPANSIKDLDEAFIKLKDVYSMKE